jgi:hypothetical protein
MRRHPVGLFYRDGPTLVLHGKDGKLVEQSEVGKVSGAKISNGSSIGNKKHDTDSAKTGNDNSNSDSANESINRRNHKLQFADGKYSYSEEEDGSNLGSRDGVSKDSRDGNSSNEGRNNNEGTRSDKEGTGLLDDTDGGTGGFGTAGESANANGSNRNSNRFGGSSGKNNFRARPFSSFRRKSSVRGRGRGRGNGDALRTEGKFIPRMTWIDFPENEDEDDQENDVNLGNNGSENENLGNSGANSNMNNSTGGSFGEQPGSKKSSNEGDYLPPLLMFYCHGGGYTAFTGDSHLELVANMCHSYEAKYGEKWLEEDVEVVSEINVNEINQNGINQNQAVGVGAAGDANSMSNDSKISNNNTKSIQFPTGLATKAPTTTTTTTTIVRRRSRKKQKMVAVIFNYRRSPQHPFPAPVEDALAAYRWVFQTCPEFAPSRTIIGGDSAGGGLCMALNMAIRDVLGKDWAPGCSILVRKLKYIVFRNLNQTDGSSDQLITECNYYHLTITSPSLRVII